MSLVLKYVSDSFDVLLGAGKTTTFSMLTGDLSITEGTAFLDGFNMQTNLREVCHLISTTYSVLKVYLTMSARWI